MAASREQRDWFHKLGNILDKLPKRLQPRVKAALHEVMYAETREQARDAAQRFATEYGAKYPKAVTTLARWRRLDGASLLPLVRAAIGFVDGVQTEGKGNKTKARAA